MSSYAYYIDPLGKKIDESTYPDLSDLSNNVNFTSKLKKNYPVYLARLKDEKELIESKKIELTVWSISAILFILAILVTIRKINKN